MGPGCRQGWRGRSRQAAGITSPGEQESADPLGTVPAADDPADHYERQDGEEDQRAERGQAQPGQQGSRSTPATTLAACLSAAPIAAVMVLFPGGVSPAPCAGARPI